MKMKSHPRSGDPSPRGQVFPSVAPRIHCCREWRISLWNIAHLKSPYWRLYWNRVRGGIVRHRGESYELGPDKVVLIAPETDYRGEFNLSAGRSPEYELIGGPRGGSPGNPDGQMDHLFVHFNFGPVADVVRNRVVELPVSGETQRILSSVGSAVADDPRYLGTALELTILSVLASAVGRAMASLESFPVRDERISRVLDFIEGHISESHANADLALIANLSLSRFEKLFAEKVGQTPGRYVSARKVEEACILLHHESLSLDEIAEHLGFYDRHHFSKVFKRYRGVSPAAYRKADAFGMPL